MILYQVNYAIRFPSVFSRIIITPLLSSSLLLTKQMHPLNTFYYRCSLSSLSALTHPRVMQFNAKPSVRLKFVNNRLSYYSIWKFPWKLSPPKVSIDEKPLKSDSSSSSSESDSDDEDLFHEPPRVKFGMFKVAFTIIAGIYFGSMLAMFGANLLEEFDIFVKGEDDDDD